LAAAFRMRRYSCSTCPDDHSSPPGETAVICLKGAKKCGAAPAARRAGSLPRCRRVIRTTVAL
jgi:hypothetical protein